MTTTTEIPNTNGTRSNGKRPVNPNTTRRARVPPHDLEAEEATLGAMLLSRDAITTAVELLTSGSFYSPAHASVFGAICDLYSAGAPSDAITVASRLDDAGGGGPGVRALLAHLIASPPSPSSVERYARIVANAHRLRQLLGVGADIIELAYDTGDADLAIDKAAGLLFPLGDAQRHSHATSLADILPGWLDLLEARYEGTETAGVSTGWVDLDRVLTGLRAGQLVTIGARPAVGKSAIGLALAANVAGAAHPTIAVSAEMSRLELTDRLVARQALVDSQAIRAASLSDRDWHRIAGAMQPLKALPLWIDDNASTTLLSIRAQARRVIQRAGHLALVIVDYVQLVKSLHPKENRQVEVAEIARGLKELALSMGITVVCLAQVNRAVEARSDKRPTLADLRESGELEAASDVVIGLYRDDIYDPASSDAGVIELIVLKQRAGPIGTVKLANDVRYGTFTNLSLREGR